MGRPERFRIAHRIGAWAALGGCIVLGACVRNDQSLFIRQVVAPPTVGEGERCKYTSDISQPILSSGILDAGLRNVYTAVFLVGNQLLAQTNKDQVRAESSRISIQGAEVHVFDVSGDELKSFTRSATGFVDPSDGINPGYAVVGVDVLDSASIESASSGIKRGETRRRMVTVRIFGTSLGNTSVESNEFSFPIDICKGCLVTFPADADDPLIEGPDCHGTSTSTSTTSASSPCYLGQDQTVTCRQCSAFDVCAAQGP